MTHTDEPPATMGETPSKPPVVVKKYANRRLYNTESSSYITLDNLADMVRVGRDFVVYDARSGDDITRGVLTQIIVEEESKGRALLPTAFLRQLIGFYGDSLGGIVPRYLEHTMSAIARQQEQMREAMHQTMGSLLPPGFDEMRRQNVAMMERAMSLFTPFYRPAAGEAGAASEHASGGVAEAGAPGDPQAEIERLQREVEQLRHLLASQPVAIPAAAAPLPVSLEPASASGAISRAPTPLHDRASASPVAVPSQAPEPESSEPRRKDKAARG